MAGHGLDRFFGPFSSLGLKKTLTLVFALLPQRVKKRFSHKHKNDTQKTGLEAGNRHADNVDYAREKVC